MNEVRILGIKVIDRIKESKRTQNVLSKYAKSIKTRFGYHELNEAVCSRVGYIILELQGEPKIWDELQNELSEIGGIKVSNISYKFSDLKQGTSLIQDDDSESIMIFSVLVDNQKADVLKFQELLSTFGCCIKSRLGLHVTANEQHYGLIIFELGGDLEQIRLFENHILKFEHLYVRNIIFKN